MKVTIEVDTEIDGRTAPEIYIHAMDFAIGVHEFREEFRRLEKIELPPGSRELLEMIKERFGDTFGHLPECE